MQKNTFGAFPHPVEEEYVCQILDNLLQIHRGETS